VIVHEINNGRISIGNVTLPPSHHVWDISDVSNRRNVNKVCHCLSLSVCCHCQI